MATGIGVRIALLDDGVDSSHPDIRISASPFNGLDFTVDPPSQNGSHNNECDFHGTNVAGVCSAIENTIGIIGTAPNSIAFSARMATNNCAGGYYTESVFISAAINHVAEAHIRILNISSGFPATQVIVNAMDYAESLRTMLIVAASGSGNAPGFPATYTYALAVAGVDGDGIGFGNSGVGSVIDVSGPASHVLTTDRVGALGRPAYSGNPDYTMQQGVSFASPAVAGVVALMLDANPRLEGVDAFQILRDTARDIYLPGRDNSTGYGLVNAAAAVNTAAALYVPGDANGDGKVTGQDLSVLLAQFGQQVPPDTGADFNGDGSVTGQDLSVLLALL